MAISKKKYGELNGRDVFEYTLDNKTGVRAVILNFGGVIKNIFIEDKDGNERDVVLGHDNMEQYKTNSGYMGALIGRHANRLHKGEFEINGCKYSAGINDGKNSLHGGIVGFDKKIWDAVEKEDADGCSLILSTVSPDGEEGFPGNASVCVTYTLTKSNELKINYRAVSDKDTVFNMTNHAYFNLNGHDSGDICDHVLQLNSNFYTPNTDECMPNGEILSVMGTPFDFRIPKPIGSDINADFEQIEMFGGYDHNFTLAGSGMRTAAVLSSEKSGITLKVATDKPGIQIYTGNSINESLSYKDGVRYKVHQAVCLETQYFPNSMACSHFPSPILRANEVYDFTTVFAFSVK